MYVVERFQVQLSESNIESILNTLIFDGKIEHTIAAGAESVKLYRAVPPAVDTTGLMRTPCGICPVSTRVPYFPR